MIYADLKSDPTFAAAWDAYDVAAPLELIDIVITVPGIGTFGYKPLALPIPSQPGQSLVIQVPDDASVVRLRKALKDSMLAVG